MEQNITPSSNIFPSAADFRGRARASLQGAWGKAALCFLVAFLIVFAICMLQGDGENLLLSMVSFLLLLFIGMPLELGVAIALLRHVRGEDPSTLVGRPFDAFKSYGRYLGVGFLTWLLVFLWSLLLIVPGIIMTYAYAMAPYIMHDHPELSPIECLRRSKAMMKGYKWKLFCLHLSFIGWLLLGIVTIGIGLLWVGPYLQVAECHFYEELKRHQAE